MEKLPSKGSDEKGTRDVRSNGSSIFGYSRFQWQRGKVTHARVRMTLTVGQIKKAVKMASAFATHDDTNVRFRHLDRAVKAIEEFQNDFNEVPPVYL